MSTQAATRERPILFSGEMVRTILEGRKTQTRRVIKPQPDPQGDNGGLLREIVPSLLANRGDLFDVRYDGDNPRAIRCPHGQPGDLLWVRETHITGHEVIDGDLQYCDENGAELPLKVWYRADNEPFFWTDDEGWRTEKVPWKPSIHMPRWASRITLEITGVQVERLQEISIDDVLAEGISEVTDGPHGNQYWREDTGFRFADLWDLINGSKKNGSWNDNPWVWVISFRRIKP
jgi:hypothetical protein